MIDENQVRTILTEELDALVERIKTNHQNAGQVASGKTRDSLKVEVTSGKNVAYGLVTARPYFAVLETGSKPWDRIPQRVPRWFAEIIGEWKRAKGVDLNEYAVAYNIIHYGSKLYREGGRSDIYSNEIQRTIDAIGERLSGMLMEIITETIKINK
jgi:hypothetical protein